MRAGNIVWGMPYISSVSSAGVLLFVKLRMILIIDHLSIDRTDLSLDLSSLELSPLEISSRAPLSAPRGARAQRAGSLTHRAGPTHRAPLLEISPLTLSRSLEVLSRSISLSLDLSRAGRLTRVRPSTSQRSRSHELNSRVFTAPLELLSFSIGTFFQHLK